MCVGVGIAQYFLPHSEPVVEVGENGIIKVPVIADKMGGDFTLMQADKPVKLSDFRGKIVVIYFGYASCPDVCPATLAVIASALRELPPKDLDRVQPIFISVDPERDHDEQLMAYATYFHPSFIGITGSVDEVQKIANQYGGFFIKSESDSALGYLIGHTSKTYMISQDGKYVTVLPHDMTSEDLLGVMRAAL